MPCPKSKTVHCSICRKAIKGKDFYERMSKLRRHRKQHHPKAHRESIRKGLKTKGILDPLKVRRRLTTKPKVLGHNDYYGEGLIRILERTTDAFPEFALYPKARSHFSKEDIKRALTFAGLKEESKGKWVLRTNKFSIFVYV